MALQVGSRLGSYSVTAKIGEGGMGEVYRGAVASFSMASDAITELVAIGRVRGA